MSRLTRHGASAHFPASGKRGPCAHDGLDFLAGRHTEPHDPVSITNPDDSHNEVVSTPNTCYRILQDCTRENAKPTGIPWSLQDRNCIVLEENTQCDRTTANNFSSLKVGRVVVRLNRSRNHTLIPAHSLPRSLPGAAMPARSA